VGPIARGSLTTNTGGDAVAVARRRPGRGGMWQRQTGSGGGGGDSRGHKTEMPTKGDRGREQKDAARKDGAQHGANKNKQRGIRFVRYSTPRRSTLKVVDNLLRTRAIHVSKCLFTDHSSLLDDICNDVYSCVSHVHNVDIL
jgi:hypothetical protein